MVSNTAAAGLKEGSWGKAEYKASVRPRFLHFGGSRASRHAFIVDRMNIFQLKCVCERLLWLHFSWIGRDRPEKNQNIVAGRKTSQSFCFPLPVHTESADERANGNIPTAAVHVNSLNWTTVFIRTRAVIRAGCRHRHVKLWWGGTTPLLGKLTVFWLKRGR